MKIFESTDERKRAMWIHLSSLIGLPFVGLFLGPYIYYWFSKKQHDPSLLKKHLDATKRFNFLIAQYCMIVYILWLFSSILVLILNEALFWVLFKIALFAVLTIYAYWSVMVVRASKRARHGEKPLYPQDHFLMSKENDQ